MPEPCLCRNLSLNPSASAWRTWAASWAWWETSSTWSSSTSWRTGTRAASSVSSSAWWTDGPASELGVAEDLHVFRGEHTGFGTARELVARCWDLEGLNARYSAFVARHLDACVALKAAGPGSVSPEEAYVRRFRLVHEYREFPLLDPFLPRELQPEGWAGECGLSLFHYYHDLLAEPASRFVDPLVELAGAGARAAAV